MIFTKDHKTRDMFDPLAQFGTHRKQRLKNSWTMPFQEEILPELPVYKLRPFYSEKKGAPTKDLYAMMGIALLQQMHDTTDEETIDRVAFDLKWHFAPYALPWCSKRWGSTSCGRRRSGARKTAGGRPRTGDSPAFFTESRPFTEVSFILSIRWSTISPDLCSPHRLPGQGRREFLRGHQLWPICRRHVVNVVSP